MSARLPLLVVLGATGTGKSKLAIELAQKFAGEIISADSMQVYRGLDIISNKVTPEEGQTVPHHLLDILDPHQEFTVQDFQNHSLPIIHDIQKRGRMPIVVGGTNYYIESLIWKVLVNPRGSESPMKLVMENPNKVTDELVGLSNEELHRRLQEVDPAMAATLHPNNRRKVLRSLEVAASGRKHSEILEQQRQQEGGGDLGGPLRFPDAILIWLRCDQTVLNERLNKRVDAMLEAGLLDELLNFHEKHNQQRLRDGGDVEYTRGIFQSIGFKEFHNYLILSKDARDSKEGQKLFALSVEEMKLATRRYSRRQVKWIQNRFLRRPGQQVPPLYAVDGTDLDQWDLKVRQVASSVIDAQLSGSPSPLGPLPRETPLPRDRERFNCQPCDRLFIGSLQWKQHLKSLKHYQKVKLLEQFNLAAD